MTIFEFLGEVLIALLVFDIVIVGLLYRRGKKLGRK